ncbi:unnamed protein product [Urochloa decumbens]|uniref:KIB1-4 beta-propeller domain-containing protein n=1 Tax=Urochloa decumbens TaxID=240449 RepID=A0ABC8WGL8_9POAL
MMRARSLRRSLADPSAGSSGLGSEGMMTRGRRRRLLAESSEPLERCHSQERATGESEPRKKTKAIVHGPHEWRDWANLLPELVEDISGRLLSLDVAEYLRFRAVCKPWRELTDDPHGKGDLDSRFRPRAWVVLTITSDARPRRRLLSLATGSSLCVDLPALSTHCHMCAADGLLVLFHEATKIIRLLNPLSNAVIEFPPISSVAAAVPLSRMDCLLAVYQNPSGINSHAINGAGFDDSTSPPTLVLCLRKTMCNIIFAKPGDTHWTLVTSGQASHPLSPEGSVYLVELSPLPRLVEVVDQRRFAEPDNILEQRIMSFLVGSSGGRMLMVRYWKDLEHFGGIGAYNRKEIFTVRGITNRIEVLEVGITGRRLIPVRSLGRHAVFVGLTHCVLISTEIFPSIAADAIYLGCFHQQCEGFSVYHINSKRSNRRTESQHKFAYNHVQGLSPAARPCNLDQYLVCYVDRSHIHSGPCIHHVKHTFF